ncbi:MAG: MFS transporter [Actinomycetota bacterium]
MTRPTDQRALASVAVQFFVNGAMFASFVPRLPEIREKIDVSFGALGATLTIASAAGLIGSLFASRVVAAIGTRWSIVVGAAVLIATLPMVGVAGSLVALGLALAVMQAFDVLVDVGMNLQGSWLSDRRSVPVMNRLHGLWSLGTVAGGLTASRLAGSSVTLTQHLLGVAAVLAAALVFIGRGLLREDETAAPVGSDPSDSVARSTLWVMGLLGAFAIAVEMISSDWAAFRLRDDFGTSVGFAGLGFVAYTSGMTVGRFGGDAVLARVGERRLMIAAISIAMVGLTAASFFPDRHVVLAAYALAGIGNATMFPVLYDRAAKLPGPPGVGVAALTAGSRVMFLTAPVIIGTLASTSLSVGAAVGVITLPSIVGFAMLTLRQR